MCFVVAGSEAEYMFAMFDASCIPVAIGGGEGRSCGFVALSQLESFADRIHGRLKVKMVMATEECSDEIGAIS